MKLHSWNVNGIRAVIRKGEWQKYLATYDPDIICLQEVKAERAQVDEEFAGYHVYWNASQARRGYSGTAILSREEPIAVSYQIPEKFVIEAGLVSDDYGHSTDEGRLMTAEYSDFYLVNVYTPNAKDDLTRLGLRQQWDQAVTAYCADLQKTKPVLYCGDMNVAHTEDDLANPKANRGKKGFTDEERRGFESWLAAGFVDTFRMFTKGSGHYSWWSHFAKSRERNVGWRIDYWLVSAPAKDWVKSASIHSEQMGSDHCPVSIEIDTSTTGA